MKLLLLIMISLCSLLTFGQSETISDNIYQSGGKLGIGTIVPEYDLTIVGENRSSFRETLFEAKLNGVSNSFFQIRNNTAGNNVFVPTLHGSTGGYDRPGLHLMGNIQSEADNGDNAIITFTSFVDNGRGWENGGYAYPNDRHYFRIRGYHSTFREKYLFEIDQDGNIGIGTKSPFAKLHVTDGDVYISDIAKGIIMKSPDGTCWRGTMQNSGQLSFTAVTCPENGGVITFSNDVDINENEEGLNIYPNPVDDYLRVDLSGKKDSITSYSIFNVNGKLLKSGSTSDLQEKIDVSELKAGVYQLKFSDSSSTVLLQKQFVKK